MPLYYEDIDNVRRNMVTVVDSGSPAYNAILYYEATSVAPIVEPVTLQEVKEYSHIDLNDDDNKITYLITQVRQLVERYTGRYLIPVSISAIVVNGLGNITLIGGNVKNVKDKDGDDVDLKETFDEAAELNYDAGYATTDVPEGLKLLMLQIIDNYIKGNYGIPDDIKKQLKWYTIE